MPSGIKVHHLRPPDARRSKQLCADHITHALRDLLEVVGTFDTATLNAAGTCLEGETLPQVRGDGLMLLLFDNGQVFEVMVTERK
jgi:hypothetical protein